MSSMRSSPLFQASRRFPRPGAQFPSAAMHEQLFWLEGQPKPANENDMSWGIDYIVEAGDLKAMGIPPLRGRFFTVHDDEALPARGRGR